MMKTGLVLLGLVATVAVVGSKPGAARPPRRCARTDVPDLKFTDTNCDGIDGVVARAVFVAPFGVDSNPGTERRPLRTLPAAVSRAAAQHKDVYVAVGAYDTGTGVQLASGVSIYGGYSRNWKRSATYGVLITGSPQAVVGDNVRGVMLQFVTLRATAAAGDELSVYGARLVGSSVTFDHDHIGAGAARAGTDGAAAGNAGAAGGGFPGGLGGPAVANAGIYRDGQSGQGPGGGAGGSQGADGSNSSHPAVDGADGAAGSTGATGQAGAGGSAAADFATSSWVGKNGADGSAGQPGGGGGGGGGGGKYS